VISARTGGPAGTEALGEALAGLLRPGDVVLLIGGLGSGKTTFVKGVARGLGYGGDVTSPTFTLCHHYAGRLDLVHVDLWRLEHRSEILDLALDEELDNGAVVVAEWGEGALPLFGERALVVSFEPAGEEERDIAVEAQGAWNERVPALAAALSEPP
jgi:tRNA threonylcarbamoyladenosine biosynthesis protein TsaE